LLKSLGKIKDRGAQEGFFTTLTEPQSTPLTGFDTSAKNSTNDQYRCTNNNMKIKRTVMGLHGRTVALARQKAGMVEDEVKFENGSIRYRCEDREITARLYGEKMYWFIYTVGHCCSVLSC
jgi:membrane-bound inhibitor of C-type lysozyme